MKLQKKFLQIKRFSNNKRFLQIKNGEQSPFLFSLLRKGLFYVNALNIVLWKSRIDTKVLLQSRRNIW